MPTPTSPIKVCACGCHWYALPARVKITFYGSPFDGAWWDCLTPKEDDTICRSTLFLPIDKFIPPIKRDTPVAPTNKEPTDADHTKVS